MKNLKITAIIILISGVLISGCGINRFQVFKHNFLVYPNEIKEQDIDRNNPREILFGQKYFILMIEKNERLLLPPYQSLSYLDKHNI